MWFGDNQGLCMRIHFNDTANDTSNSFGLPIKYDTFMSYARLCLRHPGNDLGIVVVTNEMIPYIPRIVEKFGRDLNQPIFDLQEI